jgi:ABC-type nitrate/sulfonate/bicarbonate transport system substrate-binding protein
MILHIALKRCSVALIILLAITFAACCIPTSQAASSPARVTIHVPSKSLAIMPYYLGKDKGFFSREAIEPELVTMAPPTAIAALVAGELDFSSTLGAATSAIMRGLPLKRVFYIQEDPSHVLLAQPEIKTIQDLSGKVIAVTALTDAVGMSATMILKGNGVDTGQVTLLAAQVSDNAYRALISGKVAATLMAPPYAEELEAKGYHRLAEARTYAPLSFIGLVSTIDALKKNSQKAYGLIAGLYRTLIYMHNPANRDEVIRYIAGFHKIDLPLAEKAFVMQMQSYSKDGTKPRKSVEREIEIYRETLKIAKTFTPDDLEDMSLLKKVQDAAR